MFKDILTFKFFSTIFKLQAEHQELKRRFNQGVLEVQQKTSLKNVLLEKRVKVLGENLEQKDALIEDLAMQLKDPQHAVKTNKKLEVSGIMHKYSRNSNIRSPIILCTRSRFTYPFGRHDIESIIRDSVHYACTVGIRISYSDNVGMNESTNSQKNHFLMILETKNLTQRTKLLLDNALSYPNANELETEDGQIFFVILLKT